MIKFFRKIRFDLMEKNKTGKYLKYAFGEIVLVVIGILIALSINNWNENNKSKSRLQSSLLEVKSELNADLVRLDSVIQIIEHADYHGMYLLNYLTQKPKITDSLKVQNAVVIVTILASFGKSGSAYENLIYNGNIQLVKNKKLKEKLGFYHNSKDWYMTYHDGPILNSYYDYIKAIHNYTRPGFIRKYYDAYLYITRNEIEKNEIINSSFDSHIDFDKLKSDEGLSTILDRVQLSRLLQKQLYLGIKKDIEEIIGQIDDELETLN